MDKLKDMENLPAYKKKFENYINDTITYKIGGLNEDLDKWERDISNSVDKLNNYLRAINFNRLPDTYIQLRKQPVPAGTEIKSFPQPAALKRCPRQQTGSRAAFEDKGIAFHRKGSAVN